MWRIFRNAWNRLVQASAVITLNPSQLSEVQKLLKKIKQGNKMPFL